MGRSHLITRAFRCVATGNALIVATQGTVQARSSLGAVVAAEAQVEARGSLKQRRLRRRAWRKRR
jgi:hypothetical protein